MDLKNSNINLLISKISEFIKHIYFRDFAIGIVKTLGIITLIFLTISLLETYFYFSSIIRTILIIILFAIFIISIIPAILNFYKLFKKPEQTSIESASNQIGFHFPQVKDKLLNSIQLLKNDDSNFSPQLKDAAFLDVFNSVKDLQFAKVINYSHLKYFSKITALFILIFFVFILLNQDLRSASNRVINFGKTFSKPNEFSLEIFPGNLEIQKNENVEIKIIAKGNAPNTIEFFTKNQFQSEFISQNIFLDSNKIYTLQIRNVKSSFTYFAGNKNYKTDIFKINVSTTPQITSLVLEIIPPEYSKLPKIIQNDNGNLLVLKGSKVNFNLKTSKEIINATIIINDSLKEKLIIDKKNITGTYKIFNEMNYFFEIIDSAKNKNENPIYYSVKIIPDEFPAIEITKPEQNSLLPQNNLININYTIKDDFGFSNCILNYKISETNEENSEQKFNQLILAIDKSELEQALYYNWDLTKLFLRENNIVTFFIDVFDNDNISGPKQTRSNFFKIRIPTLNELFAEVENTQENAIDELTKTMKEAEELKLELNEINNELKKNENKIDWNEKERIEQAAKKFEEVSEKIEDVKNNLHEMQNKMMQNNLLSEETMKKYEELQNLFDELNSDELKKALENLNDSMKDLMRDKVQNSLENLSMNEKAFQKSIERTLNLLKQIQIEQKMDEIVKRTEKIVENLEELKKNTNEKNSKNDLSKQNELSNEQKNIDKNISELKDEMEKLSEKMKEVENMPKQQMDDANKKFDEQKNEELSQKSLEELQKQNFDNAMQFQQQLSQNMNSMKNDLQSMQQQMQKKNQSMVMQKMLQAIDNIIDLSKEQESLKNKVENSYSQQNQYSEFMQNQMELQQNLDNIFKQLDNLSQKTFAISPEMGKALGDAKKNMMESLSGLQNKNGMGSTIGQNEAMKNLNDAASIMQNSLQSMMQGGGQGGGMMSLMQQLQQLAQQQMGLNQQTQSLRQGQLSMQQRAQVQRLAQQQSAIQKSLQDLNREAKESSESKKLASNLESVLNEMKEVVSGMNTQKVDDNLIKKQDKILSRLLDAQLSINERDYEEKRESKEGKIFDLTSPGNINLSNQQAKDILREELLKAIKEGYSKDYQDLIRRYFESLNNDVNKN
ncbi:MAG: hypothetical protein IPH62_09030 [Ignavibacteriae bacterium]|nr:hypothetical protein [Ignavibacteriota bacterium]